MAGPLDKWITLAANNCGHGATAENLILNYVYPLFLKAKLTASQENNPNWREAIDGVFFDNDWKSMKFEIATLESMDAW